MKRLVHRYAHRRSPNEMALAFMACVMAGMNIGLGATLLRASPDRTSAPTFDVIKHAAPVSAWGWIFLVTGTLAVAAQLTMRLMLLAAVHTIAGGVCLFWAGAFWQALHAPTAAVSGPWAYLALGLVHMTTGAAIAVEAWYDDKATRTLAGRR